MNLRKTILATNEVYHIFSRTIAYSPLFKNKNDYSRLLQTISFYRYKNIPLRLSYFIRLSLEDQKKIIDKLKKENKVLINIIAFCFMPNHLHFLLKQLKNKGISIFMSRLQNSYAKYFNTKYKRSGGLFQTTFKAVRIENDDQLIHVSRYIHLNPSTSYICKIKDLKKYPWSSFSHYLNRENFNFVNPKLVLGLFQQTKDYKKFVFDQADYQRELGNIKHLVFDQKV